MFKKKYSGEEHQHYFSDPGSPIRMERAPKLDKYGNMVVVDKGPIDYAAYINSWRDDCDINILMARFTSGDKDALIQRVGAYMDVSKMPDNFNDMMNLTMSAQSVFDSLPTAAKEAFGNNVNNFLSNAGTKEWVELLSKSPDDFRKELVMRSNVYSNDMRNAFNDSKKALYSSGDIKEVVQEVSGDIVEEVKRSIGGKLNEQKE